VLLSKLDQGLGRVGADADDDGVFLLDTGINIADGARLLGAARGAGLGIEIEDHLLAAEVC
jgi:hypothetical protein